MTYFSKSQARNQLWVPGLILLFLVLRADAKHSPFQGFCPSNLRADNGRYVVQVPVEYLATIRT